MRLYNNAFNSLVPRHFSGEHLQLPGASSVIQLRAHQKRVIWRIVASGQTYIAHAVGAGKTFTIAAAIMEQKRLGLIGKTMLTVPGHCLAQASREFLQLYPGARILVADETNFTEDTRLWFDRLLAEAGVQASAIVGYEVEEFTHQAVAAVVASGAADASFGLRTVAERFGLAFVSVGWETYYLAGRDALFGSGPVRTLITIVQASTDGRPGYACVFR